MAAEPKSLAAKPLIRRLRPEDVSVVMEILEESETAAAWSALSFTEMLGSTRVLALGSEGAESLTGFLFARQVSDQAELLNIAVRKNARRKGAGSALLSAALNEFRKRGIARVFLEVRESNQAAVSFYRKHGFSASGRRRAYYRDPVEDALGMEKQLRA
jgi:ribosomal-protein-alanine acetyltransferase